MVFHRTLKALQTRHSHCSNALLLGRTRLPQGSKGAAGLDPLLGERVRQGGHGRADAVQFQVPAYLQLVLRSLALFQLPQPLG